MTTTGGRPQLSLRRRRQRYWASVLWIVAVVAIMFVIVPICLAVATVAWRRLWHSVAGGDGTDIAISAGLLLGIGAWILVTYRARVLLFRVRLCRLRRSGQSAIAEVVWVAADPTTVTALEGYVVFVRWRDLAGEHLGDRCYRFWDGAPHDFLARLRRGRNVVVRYPTARPHRFVIDIPYAPSAADLFI